MPAEVYDPTAPRDEKVHLGGMGAAVGAILAKLEEVKRELRDALLSSEQEPDFDQYWSGVIDGSDLLQINLPRTIRHIEFEFCGIVTPYVAGASTSVPLPMLLIDGEQTVPYLTNIAAIGSAATLPIVCCSQGNNCKGRDYLGGSGTLTIYNQWTKQGYFNLRIRQLDATQGRLGGAD